MKIKAIVLGLFLGWFGIAEAIAAPEVQLHKTADDLIAALKQKSATIHNNPEVVYGLVRRIVLPRVDVPGMTRSVLGRQIWQNASESDRAEFQDEFVKLVIRTYSKALAKYTDETAVFYPVRGGYEGKERVVVSSTIKRTQGPDIPMTYRLIQEGDSWKIYDFSVEGVSLIQSFRSQFQDYLSSGKLQPLIKKLREHNTRLSRLESATIVKAA